MSDCTANGLINCFRTHVGKKLRAFVFSKAIRYKLDFLLYFNARHIRIRKTNHQNTSSKIITKINSLAEFSTHYCEKCSSSGIIFYLSWILCQYRITVGIFWFSKYLENKKSHVNYYNTLFDFITIIPFFDTRFFQQNQKILNKCTGHFRNRKKVKKQTSPPGTILDKLISARLNSFIRFGEFLFL